MRSGSGALSTRGTNLGRNARDLDEVSSGLARMPLLASQKTGFLICISCILYVAIANYILSKEFGFMKFYVSYSLFRKIT